MTYESPTGRILSNEIPFQKLPLRTDSARQIYKMFSFGSNYRYRCGTWASEIKVGDHIWGSWEMTIPMSSLEAQLIVKSEFSEYTPIEEYTRKALEAYYERYP